MKKLFLLALLFIQSADACSTFYFGSTPSGLIGKSYDWHQSHGLLMVNKRGVQKKSLTVIPSQKALNWKSKYGSVTFNQHGKEFPLGGMNEKGLTVEILWLAASVYPKPDEKPVLNELQWIQYQLDSAANVSEAIEAASGLRVANLYAKVHYFVCDKLGECATFEYLDGKLVYHSGKDLLAKVLTNNTYSESVKYLKRFEGFGGEIPMPIESGSLPRFVRAATLTKRTPPNGISDLEYAFDTLGRLAQANYTKWNIVYHPMAGEVYFRQGHNGDPMKILTGQLDYSCKTSSKMLDLTERRVGNVMENLVAYNAQVNHATVKLALKDISSQLPAGSLEKVAKYPETLTCTN